MIVKYSDRWLPALKEISANSFPYPAIDWGIIGEYTVRMHFSMDPVTNPNAKPSGFYAIKPFPTAVMILKLCVHPLCRGQGAGSDLLHDIEQFTLNNKCELIGVGVHEMDLCTIYWLQKRDYKALRIDRGLYPDGRDSYAFYKEIH